MPGQFDLQPSFPIAGVAQLLADRTTKEAAMRAEQQQQLVQGLQMFGSGVKSLVDRRNSMAQALAVGNALGYTPQQAQSFQTPENAISTYKAKNGSDDLNFMKTMFPQLSMGAKPTTAPAPPITTPSPIPQQPASPVLGAPQLASASPTLSGGLPPMTTAQAPTPMPTAPDAQNPTPSLLPNDPRVSKGTVMQAIKLMLSQQPRNVLQYTPGEGLKKVGEAGKGDQVITSQPGAHVDNEYDKLEGQVINRIVGIRGDKSLARTEEQRDASIQAYNTIAQIKNEHRLPNQIEYYDIIGQMWKARTGQSPTDQAIRDLDAKTLQGDLGKAYQYFSGDAAPRTTEGVMNAIQKFADVSGKQADKLHSGYMQSHLVKPKNMSQKDFDTVVKAHRGLSFEEATAESRTPQSAVRKTAGGIEYTVH